MTISIRPYQSTDLQALYEICLKTADSGKDATTLYRDLDLVGHVYAAPYAVLEPDVCFVLTVDENVSGYILGARDSRAFYEHSEKEWFTELRKRYPLPPEDDKSHDATMIRKLYSGHPVKKELLDYPAHLHIDILPVAQGMGMGRKLMDVFIDKLKSLNVSGLHLEVGKRNTGAVTFYERMGFQRIADYEYSVAFGKKCNS